MSCADWEETIHSVPGQQVSQMSLVLALQCSPHVIRLMCLCTITLKRQFILHILQLDVNLQNLCILSPSIVYIRNYF